jgi:hypothetical protein
VIGTTQPWPEARAVLDSVYRQAEAIGAEVLLAIGREDARPPADAYPELKVIERPGETIFELRRHAVTQAAGAIVAVTEDHCLVAPDWCERILTGHAELPAADVIGGAVTNGACNSIGWAGFLIANGPFLPPLETRERKVITGQANMSFKRRALWGWGIGGLDDGRYRAQLRRRGGHLYTDGRILVSHAQSCSPLAMCVLHFHGGRALAGDQRTHLPRWRWWLRLGKVSLLPLRVAVNTPRLAIAAGRRDGALWKPALRCQPWLAVVLTAYLMGEAIGHLFGPGASPNRLR